MNFPIASPLYRTDGQQIIAVYCDNYEKNLGKNTPCDKVQNVYTLMLFQNKLCALNSSVMNMHGVLQEINVRFGHSIFIQL